MHEHDFGVPIPGRILPRESWARTALKSVPQDGHLDWEQLFGRNAPVTLDLGCGNGRFLLAAALAHPERDFLGVDILPLVVRYARKRANQRGLANVRLAVIGAHELLARCIAPRSVAEIHIYHPQPCHDEDQSFRRLISPEFLSLVHRALTPTGLLVLQSDNRPYWNYLLRIVPSFFDFTEQHGPWPDAPQGRTRREIYARTHGLPVFRGIGHPRPFSAEQLAQRVAELPLPEFHAGAKRRLKKKP